MLGPVGGSSGNSRNRHGLDIGANILGEKEDHVRIQSIKRLSTLCSGCIWS